MSQGTPPASRVFRGRILVLSGPNLQLLGKREPEVYGHTTLDDIHSALNGIAAERGYQLEGRQSNFEGQLVTWLGEAGLSGFSGVIINPGAYTHTSIALLDACRACGLPVVEVHLSNPDSREEYRHRSWIAQAVWARVAGFGAGSYSLALAGLLKRLDELAAKPST